jgi:hypothetical protein
VISPPGSRRHRPVLLLLLLLATALGVAAFGAAPEPPATPTTPAATPTPSGAVTPLPGGEPTPAGAPPTEPTPTVEPTPAGTPPGPPTPTPAATASPPAGEAATVCTGSPENRAFYAAVAEAVAWAVYCPILPDGWHVDAGWFRLAAGGRLEIAYKGPDGARLEIRQGFYCGDDPDCIPAAPDAGSASFGDRPARLLDLGDGVWMVVAQDGEVNWDVRSKGLARAASVALAGAFARVSD